MERKKSSEIPEHAEEDSSFYEDSLEENYEQDEFEPGEGKEEGPLPEIKEDGKDVPLEESIEEEIEEVLTEEEEEEAARKSSLQ